MQNIIPILSLIAIVVIIIVCIIIVQMLDGKGDRKKILEEYTTMKTDAYNEKTEKKNVPIEKHNNNSLISSTLFIVGDKTKLYSEENSGKKPLFKQERYALIHNIVVNPGTPPRFEIKSERSLFFSNQFIHPHFLYEGASYSPSLQNKETESESVCPHPLFTYNVSDGNGTNIGHFVWDTVYLMYFTKTYFELEHHISFKNWRLMFIGEQVMTKGCRRNVDNILKPIFSPMKEIEFERRTSAPFMIYGTPRRFINKNQIDFTHGHELMLHKFRKCILNTYEVKERCSSEVKRILIYRKTWSDFHKRDFAIAKITNIDEIAQHLQQKGFIVHVSDPSNLDFTEQLEELQGHDLVLSTYGTISTLSPWIKTNGHIVVLDYRKLNNDKTTFQACKDVHTHIYQVEDNEVVPYTQENHHIKEPDFKLDVCKVTQLIEECRSSVNVASVKLKIQTVDENTDLIWQNVYALWYQAQVENLKGKRIRCDPTHSIFDSLLPDIGQHDQFKYQVQTVEPLFLESQTNSILYSGHEHGLSLFKDKILDMLNISPHKSKLTQTPGKTSTLHLSDLHREHKNEQLTIIEQIQRLRSNQIIIVDDSKFIQLLPFVRKGAVLQWNSTIDIPIYMNRFSHFHIQVMDGND